MRLAPLVLLSVFLLAPLASAQFKDVSVVRPGEALMPPEMRGGLVDLSVTVEGFQGHLLFAQPILVAGFDTPVNVTVTNNMEEWLNDTLVLNVTAPATAPPPLAVSLPPRSVRSFVLPVHADDVGVVRVEAALDAMRRDHALEPDLPVSPVATMEAIAVPAVSIEITEPAPLPADDEYRVVTGYGGPYGGESASTPTRLRFGDPLVVKARVVNRLESAVPAMTILLIGEQGRGSPIGEVEVPPLEPKQAVTIEFPEFRTGGDGEGGRYYGHGQIIPFSLVVGQTFGNREVEHMAASFRLASGAVEDVRPAALNVQLTDGLSVDLYIPRAMSLGTPARVKLNVTNHGDEYVRGGTAHVTLMPPGGLDYGVQGPTTHRVAVSQLAPGATVTFVFDFTPRVTGYWETGSGIRTGDGGTFSSGMGFGIDGPLWIGVGNGGRVEYARIGERIEVELQVYSEKRLDDAVLRVGSNGNRHGLWNEQAATGGPEIVGLAQTLVRADPGEVALGTLRAGEPLNASLAVYARGSGQYNVVPYVVADGFAYTSYRSTGPPEGVVMHATTVTLAVQPRVIPAGLALAPFTVLLGIVVGTWTLRTRFVK